MIPETLKSFAVPTPWTSERLIKEINETHSYVQIPPGLYEVAPPDPSADVFGTSVFRIFEKNVQILGDRVAIVATRHGNIFGISNSNVRFRGLTICGQGQQTTPNDSYFALINCVGKCGIDIANCSIRESGSHGIGHLFKGSMEGVLIEDTDFINIGNLSHKTLKGDGAGIAIHGNDIRIIDCNFTNCFRAVELQYDKEHDKPQVFSDFLLEGGTIRNGVYQGVAIMPGPGADFQRMAIIGVCFTRDTDWFPALRDQWNNYHAIHIEGGSDITIGDNEIVMRDQDTVGINLSPTRSPISKVVIYQNSVLDCSVKHLGLNLSESEAWEPASKGIRDVNVSRNLLECVGHKIKYEGGPQTGISIHHNTLTAGTLAPYYAADDPEFKACWQNEFTR